MSIENKLSYKLKNKFSSWHPGQTVLLSSGTGTGKTYFVFNDLLDNAIAHDKYLIYICNRRAIKTQINEKYKDKILASNHRAIVLTYQFCEKTKMFPNFKIDKANDNLTDVEKEVYSINDFTNSIDIQKEDVLYYVFDEAHYFVSDALFNTNTNFWIQQKLKFDNSITVFISATPEPLMCFMSEACNPSMHKALVDIYDKKKLIQRSAIAKPSGSKAITLSFDKNDKQFKKKEVSNEEVTPTDKLEESMPETTPEKISLFDVPMNAVTRSLENKKATVDLYSQDNFVYIDNSDYERFNPVYFTEYNDILKEMIYSNDKWIVFVDKEDDGIYLETVLNAYYKANKHLCPRSERLVDNLERSAVFLSAKTVKSTNPRIKKTLKGLNSDSRIIPKVLIATSIIDCGVSIELSQCPELKNVVISQPEKAEFLQMIGRVRFDGSCRNLNLYIRCIPPAKVNSLRSSMEDYLRFMSNFYLLNKEDIYHKKQYTKKTDGMGTRDYFNNNEIHNITKSTLNNKYSKLLVTKDKSFFRRRIDSKDYLSEYNLSTTSYLYVAYVLSQYNDALNSREENDYSFYLKHQLSWLGKKYDKCCWYRYNENQQELIDYLSEMKERGWFDRNEEKFPELCMSYVLDYPQVFLPPQIVKDRSRYESGERKVPHMSKLNDIFEFLEIPYKIESKRFYSPRKQTKWRVVKKESEQE